MKYIDAHAHLVHQPQGFDKIVESGAFEEIYLMDLSGYRLGHYQLATEDEVIGMVHRYPGKVYAFGHLDFTRPVSEVDRLRDKGFIGLKPYKPERQWNDPRYYPFYERAEALGMPMLFHTGMVAQAGAWKTPAPSGRGFGPGGMHPAELAGIAEAFPHLQIIGGHLGYPWIEETIQNLYYYRNICHDVSGYRHYEYLAEIMRQLDRRANEGSGRHFVEKLFFATDQFYGLPEENERALKLKQMWSLLFELVGAVYHDWGQPENMEKFFYGNARTMRENAMKGTNQ